MMFLLYLLESVSVLVLFSSFGMLVSDAGIKIYLIHIFEIINNY